MKILVLMPNEIAEQYDVQRVVELDMDAYLSLPFDDYVKLEEQMPGGLSLQRLRWELAEYSGPVIRGLAWLALKQAGKTVEWATFKPDPGSWMYVMAPGEVDADPPASGGSSPAAPVESSSATSGRRSRGSTASRPTRSRSSK